MTESERIERAIEIGIRYGGMDGEHHKTWTIDQMLRKGPGLLRALCSSVPKAGFEPATSPFSPERSTAELP